MLARLTLIGVALAVIAGTFAYLGGWLTPNALTPARFTDAFEEVNGLHPGFRRNHAKGVGVSGFFESNGAGVRLSRAAVFQPGHVPVLGRFSLGGGQPYAPDTLSAARGLGLQFSLPDGELWRTSMIHLPVFPFRTPEAFYAQLIASRPDPGTGKPDPAKMQAFVARHPEFAVVPPAETAGVLWDKAEAFAEAALQSPEGWLMTPRRTGTDGFFVSILRRTA